MDKVEKFIIDKANNLIMESIKSLNEIPNIGNQGEAYKQVIEKRTQEVAKNLTLAMDVIDRTISK